MYKNVMDSIIESELEDIARQIHGVYISEPSSAEDTSDYDSEHFENEPPPVSLDSVVVIKPFQIVQSKKKKERGPKTAFVNTHNETNPVRSRNRRGRVPQSAATLNLVTNATQKTNTPSIQTNSSEHNKNNIKQGSQTPHWKRNTWSSVKHHKIMKNQDTAGPSYNSVHNMPAQNVPLVKMTKKASRARRFAAYREKQVKKVQNKMNNVQDSNSYNTSTMQNRNKKHQPTNVNPNIKMPINSNISAGQQVEKNSFLINHSNNAPRSKNTKCVDLKNNSDALMYSTVLKSPSADEQHSWNHAQVEKEKLNMQEAQGFLSFIERSTAARESNTSAPVQNKHIQPLMECCISNTCNRPHQLKDSAKPTNPNQSTHNNSKNWGSRIKQRKNKKFLGKAIQTDCIKIPVRSVHTQTDLPPQYLFPPAPVPPFYGNYQPPNLDYYMHQFNMQYNYR